MSRNWSIWVSLQFTVVVICPSSSYELSKVHVKSLAETTDKWKGFVLIVLSLYQVKSLESMDSTCIPSALLSQKKLHITPQLLSKGHIRNNYKQNFCASLGNYREALSGVLFMISTHQSFSQMLEPANTCFMMNGNVSFSKAMKICCFPLCHHPQETQSWLCTYLQQIFLRPRFFPYLPSLILRHFIFGVIVMVLFQS